ncbi:MAG: glycosyltransferase family 2 protein [Muribaculaceae bacterium]|nr:glycosyltransferase family 2 protein [Muribaculaceae bacterium]
MTFEIAIIIPTLNEERYISECLKSVFEQSFEQSKLDIIIADGGSTDQTCNIIENIAKSHQNVRLIRNEKKIQSVAFNLGVAISSAPYIIRLDAHALYNRNYVELCYNNLVKNGNIGNVGGVCSIRPQHFGIIPEANAILNQVKFGIGGAAFRIGAEAGFVDTVPFGAFPRKVIEKIGGMREELARGEDNEYNSRIKKAGYKIYLDPNIISTYYSRDTIKGSIKQMYANGLSIGKLLQIDRKSVSIRHLIPLCFVLSIIISFLIGLMYQPLLWIVVLIIGTYTIANLIATISACIKFGWKYIYILPILFFTVHFSYGIGTIIGLFKG